MLAPDGSASSTDSEKYEAERNERCLHDEEDETGFSKGKDHDGPASSVVPARKTIWVNADREVTQRTNAGASGPRAISATMLKFADITPHSGRARTK